MGYSKTVDKVTESLGGCTNKISRLSKCPATASPGLGQLLTDGNNAVSMLPHACQQPPALPRLPKSPSSAEMYSKNNNDQSGFCLTWTVPHELENLYNNIALGRGAQCMYSFQAMESQRRDGWRCRERRHLLCLLTGALQGSRQSW